MSEHDRARPDEEQTPTEFEGSNRRERESRPARVVLPKTVPAAASNNPQQPQHLESETLQRRDPRVAPESGSSHMIPRIARDDSGSGTGTGFGADPKSNYGDFNDILIPGSVQISHIEPGQILFGKYEVVRKLGEGGMGAVWLVRHLELDCDRALKTIASNIAAKDEARQRFRREARAMASFSHPNAVTIHDFRLAKDLAYIDMEYVRGESLETLLQPGVPMPPAWIRRVVEQLCDVLQEAHEKRIVHRDLKPSNLMLLSGRPLGREHLKVLDFGIAKILEEAELSLTNNVFLGTAAYASPEQANGDPVDDRSDIYSVGVLIYQFLTGCRPFTGPVVRQVYDLVNTPPPPMATRNPDAAVPPEVEEVVMRCLAKTPDKRPQSARELADEFLGAFDGGARRSSVRHNRPPAAPRNNPRESAPVPATATAPAPPPEHHAPATQPTPPPVANLTPPPGVPAGIPAAYLPPGYPAAVMPGVPMPYPQSPEEALARLAAVGMGLNPYMPLPYAPIPTPYAPGAHIPVPGAAPPPPPPAPPGTPGAKAAAQSTAFVSRPPDNAGKMIFGGVEVTVGGGQEGVPDLAPGTLDAAQNEPSPGSSVVVQGPLGRDETNRFTLPGVVLAAKFLPGSRKILVGGRDDKFRIFDASANQLLREFSVSGPFSTMLVSPDASRVLAGCREGVKVVSVESGLEINRFEQHREYISALAITPDGSLALSGGGDQVARFWNTRTGQQIQVLRGHKSAVWATAFLPHGPGEAPRFGLTGGEDHTLRLWDLNTGDEIRCLEGHSDWVTAILTAPRSSLVVTGGMDDLILVWDVDHGAVVRELKGHSQGVTALAISPDGRLLVSASKDKTARVWDLRAGREIARLDGHEDGLTCVAWADDMGRLASGGRDGTIRVWRVPNESRAAAPRAPSRGVPAPPPMPQGHAPPPRAPADGEPPADPAARKGSILGRLFGGKT